MQTVKSWRLWLLTLLVIAGGLSAGLGAAAGRPDIAAESTSVVTSYTPSSTGTGHASADGIWMGDPPRSMGQARPNGIWMGD